jgi:acyl-CoA synthetase (AMP-forming)/AMP-acid ligase II
MVIHEILAWGACQWPEREFIAEVDPVNNRRRSLTYKQFNDRANRIANALFNMGIKKGDMVFHFMRNRIEWMETFFGIIKTGAIVVPLNFRFTSADVKYCADVVRPSLVIFEEELLDIIKPIQSLSTTVKEYIGVGKNIPTGIKNYEQLIANFSVSQPNSQVSEEDDLALYFTSGTTGTPKSILFCHKNFYEAAVCNGLTLPLPPNPNTILVNPLFHLGPFGLWLPYLLQGGKCTLLQKFSAHYLLKTIEQEKATEANLVMPHAVDLIQTVKSGGIHLADYDLSSWYSINTGSQAFATRVLQDLLDLFPHVNVRHNYGLSESVGAYTTTTVTREELHKKLGSIGKPAFMVDCRIVDGNGDEVGPGEIGELIFRTKRMMKGYYKNPEETAKTIKDGWLYTGDIAKKDEDGYIYIVDRKKDIIVSGGENVYPIEVEKMLLTHPKISDAAVIGTPDEKFGERVTAVVTLKSDERLTEDELLEWCKEKFPAFKRPRRIEFGNIPRSSAQKILRTELRQRYTGKKTVS